MKSKKTYITALLAVLLIGMSSCKRLSFHSFGRGELLAKVGNTELYTSDIKGVFYAGITEQDSIDLLNRYINEWVRTRVKIDNATAQFAQDDKNIESLIESYRNSLLINKYDNYHTMDIDTVVTDQEIITYYDTNKNLFKLSYPIVRGILFVFPENFKNSKQLLKLARSNKEDDRKDLLELVQKHGYKFKEFNDWVYFDKIAEHVPMKEMDTDDFLRNNFYYEVTDRENKYILQIESYRKRGDLTPLNMVSASIKKMIINSRKSERIKIVEDSIYNNAILNNEIELSI